MSRPPAFEGSNFALRTYLFVSSLCYYCRCPVTILSSVTRCMNVDDSGITNSSMRSTVSTPYVWRRAGTRGTWRRRWKGWYSCWWTPVPWWSGRTSYTEIQSLQWVIDILRRIHLIELTTSQNNYLKTDEVVEPTRKVAGVDTGEVEDVRGDVWWPAYDVRTAYDEWSDNRIASGFVEYRTGCCNRLKTTVPLMH